MLLERVRAPITKTIDLTIQDRGLSLRRVQHVHCTSKGKFYADSATINVQAHDCRTSSGSTHDVHGRYSFKVAVMIHVKGLV